MKQPLSTKQDATFHFMKGGILQTHLTPFKRQKGTYIKSVFHVLTSQLKNLAARCITTSNTRCNPVGRIRKRKIPLRRKILRLYKMAHQHDAPNLSHLHLPLVKPQNLAAQCLAAPMHATAMFDAFRDARFCVSTTWHITMTPLPYRYSYSSNFSFGKPLTISTVFTDTVMTRSKRLKMYLSSPCSRAQSLGSLVIWLFLSVVTA